MWSKAAWRVAEDEARLPTSGVLEVKRCSGCGRALWYRSTAYQQIASIVASIGLLRLRSLGFQPPRTVRQPQHEAKA